MRLFLMAVLCGSVLAGCKKDDSKAGALNVTVGYSGFTRGCVTVTATDVDDAQNTSTLNVAIPGKTPGSVAVAVFREKDWGRVLKVTTQLREFDCAGEPVGDPQEMNARVPEEGKLDVGFTVKATDTDKDGYFSAYPEDLEATAGNDCNDNNENSYPGIANDGLTNWYRDADGDSFGDEKATPVRACKQPAGFVKDAKDCNDANALIHPATLEQLCDGVDDNCSGAPDENFKLGELCTSSEQYCGPTNRCSQDKLSAECFSATSATPWYVDADGDGREGAAAGVSCVRPEPDAVAASTDCDESSTFVNNGLPEACDRLDNNCTGGVDEGCGALTWSTNAEIVTPQLDLTAIALYDQGRKSWIVGPNKLLHLDSTTPTIRDFSDGSCRKDWRAAWTSEGGRGFFVGKSGWVSTRLITDSGEACYTFQPSSNTDFNGVFGVDDPSAGPTAYAVASNGKIYRWAPPYDETNLTEVADVPANLRAIGGTKNGNMILAVGSGDANEGAQVYRYDATTNGPWALDPLAAPITGFLKGIHVTDSRFAYAAGENGVVIKRTTAGWGAPLPTVFEAGSTTNKANIGDILAFSEKGIYVSTNDGNIMFYDGGTVWTPAYTGTKGLFSLDGSSPSRIAAVGAGSTLVNFTPPAPTPP
ncbi:putative metal-binding motif-containing protein [Corallococcus terminator]|uniref:Lipoprotein n=1 Tax=Corallococcus terminator TaxID=2316733 RepID=A0A3A8IKN7_9BACT|nr:putative metal-binding motif-containing protein [Corallococcus terminator]RKG84009.1 hypothetical protein D7V88_22860 [Corallococcus terminator]